MHLPGLQFSWLRDPNYNLIYLFHIYLWLFNLIQTYIIKSLALPQEWCLCSDSSWGRHERVAGYKLSGHTEVETWDGHLVVWPPRTFKDHDATVFRICMWYFWAQGIGTLEAGGHTKELEPNGRCARSERLISTIGSFGQRATSN